MSWPCLNRLSHEREPEWANMWAKPYMANLAERTSDDVLDTVYGWPCGRRTNQAPDDVDR